MLYRSEPYDPARHSVDTFRCGKEPLDCWLRESADRAAQQDTARTYVWTDDSGVVVAYYALSGHSIRRSETSERKGRVPEEVPATLLCKLALSQELHGQHLGTQLLVDAVTRCAASNEIVASRFVLADAIDEEAEQFYAKHNFKPTQTERRLYLRTKSAAASAEF